MGTKSLCCCLYGGLASRRSNAEVVSPQEAAEWMGKKEDFYRIHGLVNGDRLSTSSTIGRKLGQ